MHSRALNSGRPSALIPPSSDRGGDEAGAPCARLVEIAGMMVPRYTSYPTAPHFSGAVDPRTYGRWLDDAASGETAVSLYLHVPFCRSICHYCGCNTKASRSDDPIRDYADVLRAEIALVAARLGRVEISHIHWGGGTPNLLPQECLESLVDMLSHAFRFRDGMEHAIELDPRHVGRSGARHLARMGVNRASLGIQDLDEDVQVAIGRAQPLPVVEEAVAALREAGIDALNFDLMYGLPLQTPRSILATVEQVLELRPSRIALFGYAHVPWMKSHQRLIREETLPGIAERLTLARTARHAICKAGYAEIGMDHFARPEDELFRALATRTLRRNFQGYTVDGAETLVGFGASSIGRTRWGYAQNASDNSGWARAVRSGTLPVARGRAFAGDDMLRARVIEDILCYLEADLSRHASAANVPVSAFDESIARLEPLIREGWVSLDERGRLSIDRHGTEIARVVASAFDSYFGGGNGRHSIAA